MTCDVIRSTHEISPQFVARACEFYHCCGTWRYGLSSIWQPLVDGYYGKLVQALEDRNEHQVAQILNTSELLWHGMNLSNELSDSDIRTITHIFLLRAGIAAAVIRNPNPDQPDGLSWDSNETANEIIEELERFLGLKSLSAAMGGRRRAIKFGSRIIPCKLAESAGHWVQLRRLLPAKSPLRIVEIGGGIGASACLFGAMDLKGFYELVDLPPMTIIQAASVAASFGEDAVQFEHEPTTMPNAWLEARLWPISPGSLSDAIININSLPEIPESIGRFILERCIDRLSSNGVVYSCNQESASGGQITANFMIGSFDCLKLIFRSGSLILPHYIEEAWVKL